MKRFDPATRFIVAATSLAGGSQCEQCSFSNNIFSNESAIAFDLGKVSTESHDTANENSISINSQKYEKWTRKLEDRFDELIVKEYTRSATKEELLEFKELTEVRERLKSPMSADEIIAEMNREKAMNDLISALKNYRKYVG